MTDHLSRMTPLHPWLSDSSASPWQHYTLYTAWVHEELLCDFSTSGNPEYQIKSSSPGKNKKPKHRIMSLCNFTLPVGLFVGL